MSNFRMTIKNSKQQGFTLIELMVSITLGAIISAAVIQVFITSQRVDGMQRSASEIQTSSIFGLQSIERQIRYANLGNEGLPVSDTTQAGGIVFTTNNGTVKNSDDEVLKKVNVFAKMDSSGDLLQSGYLTVGGTPSTVIEGENDKWDGSSNTGIKSDQLTFQYKNVVTEKTGVNLYDCTGDKIEAGDRVIQRYYLGSTDSASATAGKFSLMCEAGRIIKDTTTPKAVDIIKDFGNGSGSVVIIDDVDQFNIRLGSSRENLTKASGKLELQYFDLSIEEYIALTGAKPYITNIKIALLARSNSNAPETSSDNFVIFGETQTLNNDSKNLRLLRRVFETNILLRNARVIDVK